MAVELYAGTLANFNDSMAKEIENSLAALMGPLPLAPQKLVEDRRVLFIAIANGVINHLKNKQAAVEVTFDIGFGTVTATTDIKVKS
jgi:hypothetical protein